MLQGGDRRSRGPCSKLSAQPLPTSRKSVHAFALPLLCGESIPTLLPWKGIMKTKITGSFHSQSRPYSLGPSASVLNGSAIELAANTDGSSGTLHPRSREASEGSGRKRYTISSLSWVQGQSLAKSYAECRLQWANPSLRLPESFSIGLYCLWSMENEGCPIYQVFPS